MSENIANGVDFFKSVLEAPVYANTPSSDIIINPLDMEKFDILSDQSNFQSEIYLIIGDSLESREVLRARFTRTVTNNIVSRSIVLLEPSERDYYSGTLIFCGSSIRYIQDIKSEVSSIKDSFQDFISTVDVVKKLYAVEMSNISNILDNVGFSETSPSLKSLVISAFDNNTGWGISSTENIYTYKLQNDCGQLKFILPKNAVEEDRHFILLDVSDLPVSSNLMLNHIYFTGDGDNTYPHVIVLTGIFTEGIFFNSFPDGKGFVPFSTISQPSSFTDVKVLSILKDTATDEKFAWPLLFLIGFENILEG